MEESRLQITKSLFMAGSQCAKRFYLLAKQPELATSPTDDVLLRFSQGQNVGVLARSAFPDGVLISASGAALPKALEQTSSLIRE